MDDIIELARRLGAALAASPQTTKLKAVRAELQKDAQLNRTLGDYQRQAQKVGQLEQDNKPVEVDDKHRLQELHDQLVASDLFKRYTAAQVEYLDLMRRVNDELRKHLRDVEQPQPPTQPPA
jgi:cell fate (sporulation/competence/biofilm development) regulator YlbF (YheA/YmcA/DUF963 family)